MCLVGVCVDMVLGAVCVCDVGCCVYLGGCGVVCGNVVRVWCGLVGVGVGGVVLWCVVS